VCIVSNGFIRLCSIVFCWAAISACHALLSSHMTNKDDDDKVKHIEKNDQVFVEMTIKVDERG